MAYILKYICQKNHDRFQTHNDTCNAARRVWLRMSKPEGENPLKPCDENIMKTIMLTDQMLALAEQGDAQSEDAGCGILYGIMRDSAYKILQLAEKEKQKHINKGWWRDRC